MNFKEFYLLEYKLTPIARKQVKDIGLTRIDKGLYTDKSGNIWEYYKGKFVNKGRNSKKYRNQEPEKKENIGNKKEVKQTKKISNEESIDKNFLNWLDNEQNYNKLNKLTNDLYEYVQKAKQFNVDFSLLGELENIFNPEKKNTVIYRSTALKEKHKIGENFKYKPIKKFSSWTSNKNVTLRFLHRQVTNRKYMLDSNLNIVKKFLNIDVKDQSNVFYLKKIWKLLQNKPKNDVLVNILDDLIDTLYAFNEQEYLIFGSFFVKVIDIKEK